MPWLPEKSNTANGCTKSGAARKLRERAPNDSSADPPLHLPIKKTRWKLDQTVEARRMRHLQVAFVAPFLSRI